MASCRWPAWPSSASVTRSGRASDNVEVKGPLRVTGVSDTPSRRKVCICQPTTAAEELPCARQILANVAGQAFRRPPTDDDLAGALMFYRDGQAHGGFDNGIQKGVMAILASPKFLYRAQSPSPEARRQTDSHRRCRPGVAAVVLPVERAAGSGTSRSGRAGTSARARSARAPGAPHAGRPPRPLAGHQLCLPMAERSRPGSGRTRSNHFSAVHRATWSLHSRLSSSCSSTAFLSADRSVLDLLTSDYTFLNERLALHYGIKGVRGGEFRKVTELPS